MTWGGNHSLEVTKKEYIKQIQEMTGKKNTIFLRSLDKKELKRLKEMIEEARYRAIDEYRKGVAELECRLEYENREKVIK